MPLSNDALYLRVRNQDFYWVITIVHNDRAHDINYARPAHQRLFVRKSASYLAFCLPSKGSSDFSILASTN